MHIRNVSSFFLTKSTGAPQGDELGRINPLSNNSCSCVESSFSSAGSNVLQNVKSWDRQ
ncbi:hypothetical protein Hanom_Chr13g01225601 [Helianthus anomalus]